MATEKEKISLKDNEILALLKESVMDDAITCRGCGTNLEADGERCGLCGWKNPKRLWANITEETTMDGIELRIGYKEDLTENGLYWCFSREMTLKEVKQEIQKSLKGTEREHFLSSLKIILWKDWKTWKDYGTEKCFIQDMDGKKTLEQILDEWEEKTGKTGEKIRMSKIVPMKQTNPTKGVRNMKRGEKKAKIRWYLTGGMGCISTTCEGYKNYRERGEYKHLQRENCSLNFREEESFQKELKTV